MSDLDYDELATAIARKLAPAVDPNRLWSYSDAGIYAGVSESTIRRLEKQNPDFPQARVKQTGDSGSTVTRFVAREIIDWFERKPLSRAG